MAARRNKKRSFLFVSKVLGKHLPISPSKGLLIGSLLAEQFSSDLAGMRYENELKLSERFLDDDPHLPEAFIPAEISPVIIGFAETATALGHAFFAAFKKADYFHTTREIMDGEVPEITFEEEHSHATSHRCYISGQLLDNRREIVLVDDEMSTGKTALNIIRSIHAKFPRDVYSVVSILDWRSDADVQKFRDLEKELRIKINCISILQGKFTVSGHSPEAFDHGGQATGIQETSVKKLFLKHETASDFYGGKLEGVPYMQYSGRFGLSECERNDMDRSIQEIAAELSKAHKGNRTLCVGTGEFMYIPMKIAAYMGGNVSYQSTTRSPIHIVNREGYGARYGMSFPSPEDPQVQHFLYNVAPGQYDEAFVFFEREVPDRWLEPMINEFRKSCIPAINIVFFNGQGGDGHD